VLATASANDKYFHRIIVLLVVSGIIR